MRVKDKYLNPFEQAEIANFDDEEYSKYEESLKTYRDLKNSFDTAREEGREEGRREGREEGRREGGKEEKITIAGKLKRQKVPPEIISQSTGLRIEEIEKGLDNFSHCESMLRLCYAREKTGISGVHTFRKRNSA